MSWRISLAADKVRCDRLRTSVATTAKPRPCSPARAASTAAFSARMLVWNAMESISCVISLMRPDAVWICFMVLATPSTASLLRSATWVA